MPQVHIPFMEKFREPMLNGTKILTTRTKKYGQPGDWFNAFGKTFVLIRVEQWPLAYAATNWKLEGCDSYEDFVTVWKKIHPRRAYNENEYFWGHDFRDISRKENHPLFVADKNNRGMKDD
jgi:hypothetical protein